MPLMSQQDRQPARILRPATCAPEAIGSAYRNCFMATHPSHWTCSNGAALGRSLIAPAVGVSVRQRVLARICGGRAS
jgi:hypothetical protein